MQNIIRNRALLYKNAWIHRNSILLTQIETWLCLSNWFLVLVDSKNPNNMYTIDATHIPFFYFVYYNSTILLPCSLAKVKITHMCSKETISEIN